MNQERRHHKRARRGDGQRGVAAVEFVVIALPLLIMAFAIIEGGFLMRNNLMVSSAVQEAVRSGSISGPELDADYLMLQTLQANVIVGDHQIKRIIVFHARHPTDTPSATCLAGTSVSTVSDPERQCNVYTPSDFYRNVEAFGCTTSLDSSWCPSDRSDRGATFGSTDLVGVYMEVEHEFFTGFFGQALTMERQSILPLERGKA